jgi:hypothetical protein
LENQLTASALNALFASLPVRTPNYGSIFIDGNPGTDTCDSSIAENKGCWAN